MEHLTLAAMPQPIKKQKQPKPSFGAAAQLDLSKASTNHPVPVQENTGVPHPDEKTREPLSAVHVSVMNKDPFRFSQRI